MPPPPRVRGLLSGGRGLGSGSGSWFGREGELQQGGRSPPPSAHSPSLIFVLSLDSATYPLGSGVCGCELWEQKKNSPGLSLVFCQCLGVVFNLSQFGVLLGSL